MQKCDFFRFKMSAIRGILSNKAKFCPRYVSAKYDEDLCKIVLGPGQRFEHTFCLRRRQRLQTSQTHTGPTLHVGPNKTYQDREPIDF